MRPNFEWTFRRFLQRNFLGRIFARLVIGILCFQMLSPGLPTLWAAGNSSWALPLMAPAGVPAGGPVTLNFAADAFGAGSPATTLTFNPCFDTSARSKAGKVQLTWPAVAGATGYRIYRGADADPVVFSRIGEVPATLLTALDLPPANERTWLYAVGALTPAGLCFSGVTAAHPTAARGLANHPPVIYSPAVTSAAPGVPYSYDVNAADPNGDVLSYRLLAGPAGMTIDPNSGLIAWGPQPGTFNVMVEARDPAGATDIQTYQLSAAVANTPPVANAGPDQAATVTQTVMLDGSASTDLDGDPLTRSWSFVSRPAGSVAALSDAAALNPTFVLDRPGNYVVQLIVNDGIVNSAPDTVTISTRNTLPVASAGSDQSTSTGLTVTLDGSASSDVDGDPLTYFWSFASLPAGSAALLSSSAAAKPAFTLDRPGNYEVRLVVNDGTADSAPDFVTVSTVNSPPVANAGANQSTPVGQTVTLDGSASTDVDGDPLTYFWSFTSRPAGSAAVLSDPAAAKPIFTVDRPGNYVVQLIVNDGTVDGLPVTVTVSTSNTPPVANAGPDQSALVTQTVTLNGGLSSDVDGNPLTYAWSIISRPAGSSAALSDPAAAGPTFVLDRPGSYVVQLIVNDGFVNSAPDTVTVSTLNSPPVANAGANQSMPVGQTVTLDGSASTDVDGDTLTYFWSFTSRPAGSAAVLSDATVVTPAFSIDLPGTYVVQLIVNDGQVDGPLDTVTISTVNSVPVANAGPDQSALVTQTVTLNGGLSSDVDGNPLTYAWSITSRPAGSSAALSDPAAAGPTFVLDRPGSYVVQLIVNDGFVNSVPDTVTVSTLNSPPVANAGANQSTPVGQTVTLDGTASTDVDGDPLTYLWSLTSRPAGSAAVLSDPAAARPTFAVDRPGNYVVQLIVNDGTVNSAPDSVTVSTINSPPVANAGTDQSTPVGRTITVNGSASTDVDGDALTYFWSITSRPAGSTAALTDAGAVMPLFNVDKPGAYVLQLIVNDGQVDSAPDTMTVSTVNSPPVAHAGPDQSARVGQRVTLDGNQSSDVDGDALTFSWSIIGQPPGSTATLSAATAASPEFTLDRFGDYVVQLIVSDGQVNSLADTVTISTLNTKPVAGAGADRNVETGTLVTLDGSASADADGTPLTYRWSLTTKPAGSLAVLSSLTAVNPSFTADLSGIYVAQLIVNDGTEDSDPDTITLTAAPRDVTVPNVVGLARATGEAGILAAGLTVGAVAQTTSPTVPAGNIISQSPAAGATVSAGTAVNLVVSLGPPPVLVPDVVGLAQAAAAAAITAAQLTVGTVTTVNHPTVPAGNVISQAPVAGTPVPPGSAVNLTVSLGPPPVLVPDVVGLAQAAATAAITAAQLTIGTVSTANHPTVPAGNVISQSPDAGVMVAPGSAVNLVVSLGAAVDDEPPLLTASLSAPIYPQGSPASLSIVASDNSGTVNVTFVFDGGPAQPANLPITAIATGGLGAGTSHTVTITAVDPSANTASQTLVFGISDPADLTGPVVALTSPGEGTVLSAPTEVIGTASDPNLIQYKLEYAPQGTNDFVTFETGTNSVVGGVLGNFDATIVRDGTYQIRLSCLDAGGRTSSASRYVEVARSAKLGQFSVSFTDESVPFGAFPLSVIRNYDSRDRSVSGEFGFGWSLDVSKATATQNRVLGADWRESRSGGFIPTYSVSPTAPHTVTIKLSEDHEAKFEMGVSPASQQLLPIEFANATFTRVKGEGSLQANTTGVIILDFIPGPVSLLDDGTFDVYNPNAFSYTALDGFRYGFNRKSNLRFELATVTDPNGTTLQLTSAGLTRSDGVGISFTRDAQMRITQCVDPNGNVTRYSYDSRGDLAEVIDPQGGTTRFVYDSNHFLIKILDPLSRPVQRQEYDDDGRLIAITDANGERVDLEYDLGNNTQIVRDRRGNPTIYRYDAAGNVIEQTDLPEVGGVPTAVTKSFTYDAKGNVISETDGLGNISTSTYDANGNLLTRRDARGNTERFTYNGSNKVLTHTDRRGNVTTNTYDALGRLTARTDKAGKTSAFAYDARGNLVRETDPLGNVRTFVYDATGKKTSETDALGRVTTFTYDANGNKETETRMIAGMAATTTFVYDARDLLVETIDPVGNVTRTVRDAAGKEVAKIDGEGNSTETNYDSRGNIIGINFPDGSFTTTTFDSDGNKASVTNRNGEVTTFAYDALDQLTRVVRPDGSTLRMQYNAGGRLARETDERGNVTTHNYDAVGMRLSTTQPGGELTQYTYDPNGNRTGLTDANGHTTQFDFDSLDRLITTTYPDGTTATVTYDPAGRTTAKKDPMGNTTNFAYDAVGNLIRVTDALGGVTSYTYDEEDRRVSQTDANGHTTSFEYDLAGNRVARILPGGQREEFTHNANGKVITHTDFAGVTHTFAYDEVGRRTLASYADGTLTTTTYNGEGAPLTVTDSRGVTTYVYDNRGRLIRKDDPVSGAVTYTYDAVGNQLSVTSPGGTTTTHTYNGLNRLTTSTDASGGVTTYVYDGVGNLVQVNYPNGTLARHSYNIRNQLTKLANLRSDNSAISSFTYTLNANGLRTKVEELGGNRVDYTYDAMDRVLTEVRVGASAYSDVFTYDLVGNRLTRNHNGNLTTCTYDANDRLLSDGAGTAFAYDANGNLASQTGIAGVTTYRYDSLNRLTRSTNPSGTTIQYDYDSAGNRCAIRDGTGTVVTRYVVDGRSSTGVAQVMEEQDGAGATRVAFTYGLDLLSQDRGGVRSYYHYDGLGSTRQLSDTLGTITDAYVYDAFGREVSASGVTQNPYRFAGEQLDPALGFYFLRARYYSPEQGRFIGMDPFEGDPQSPVSLHRYLYANNNPVNYIDPTGEFTLISVSISISIDMNIRSIYTQNLVKFFFKAAKIAFCTIEPGYKLRDLGFDMLASGTPGGEHLVLLGQEIIAAGYRAIGSEIVETYKNIANDIVKVKVEVGGLIKDIIDAAQGGQIPVPVPEEIQKLIELKEKIEGYLDEFAAVMNDVDRLINGSNCERFTVLANRADQIAGLIPGF